MGSIHLEAMVRVLGHADLPLVVDTVIEHMRQKVLRSIYPWYYSSIILVCFWIVQSYCYRVNPLGWPKGAPRGPQGGGLGGPLGAPWDSEGKIDNANAVGTPT